MATHRHPTASFALVASGASMMTVVLHFIASALLGASASMIAAHNHGSGLGLQGDLARDNVAAAGASRMPSAIGSSAAIEAESSRQQHLLMREAESTASRRADSGGTRLVAGKRSPSRRQRRDQASAGAADPLAVSAEAGLAAREDGASFFQLSQTGTDGMLYDYAGYDDGTPTATREPDEDTYYYDGIDGGVASNASASDGEEGISCDMPLWQPGAFACTEGPNVPEHDAWTDPWGNDRAITRSGGKCTVSCPKFYHAKDQQILYCKNGQWASSQEGETRVKTINCQTAFWMKIVVAMIILGLIGACVGGCYFAVNAHYMSGVEAGAPRRGLEPKAGASSSTVPSPAAQAQLDGDDAGKSEKSHKSHGREHHHHHHSGSKDGEKGKDGESKTKGVHMPHLPSGMADKVHLPGHKKD